MLGLGSIGYVQSFQYVLINIEPIRPSDYSQFVFLALCVFDFDIPALAEWGFYRVKVKPFKDSLDNDFLYSNPYSCIIQVT